MQNPIGAVSDQSDLVFRENVISPKDSYAYGALFEVGGANTAPSFN